MIRSQARSITAASTSTIGLAIAVIRLMRPHQWTKNLLVLVPVFTIHRWSDAATVSSAVIMLIAFSLMASGVYALNDWLDIDADRKHPTKRHRPFASGELSPNLVWVLAPFLSAVALWLASTLSLRVAGLLLGYWLVTTAYSVRIKRVMMADVILLSTLYTYRILAGAVAADIQVSFWLFAFSMFFFLSLAMVKRVGELVVARESGGSFCSARGYRPEDLAPMMSLGTASGYAAALVFALYINSDHTRSLYGRPDLLWLVFPLLLYWLGRVWVLAHRGEMPHDPVVFALRDRLSYALGLGVIAIVYCAL